jgi:hypothetical protein
MFTRLPLPPTLATVFSATYSSGNLQILVPLRLICKNLSAFDLQEICTRKLLKVRWGGGRLGLVKLLLPFAFMLSKF